MSYHHRITSAGVVYQIVGYGLEAATKTHTRWSELFAFQHVLIYPLDDDQPPSSAHRRDSSGLSSSTDISAGLELGLATSGRSLPRLKT